MIHSSSSFFHTAAVCLFLAAAAILSGCESEAYDSGDGEYSNLHADFADVQTKQTKSLVAALLDTGESVTFQSPLTCEWAEVPASTYRALLYYYPTATANVVKPYAAQPVYVLRWKDMSSVTLKTDPIHMQSIWISENAAYINLRIGIMVGNEDDGSRGQQMIGVTLDNAVMHEDGTYTYTLTLRHAQNDVPQYYTSQQYISLPVNECKTGDTIILNVNTYEGQKQYTLNIKK